MLQAPSSGSGLPPPAKPFPKFPLVSTSKWRAKGKKEADFLLFVHLMVKYDYMTMI